LKISRRTFITLSLGLLGSAGAGYSYLESIRLLVTKLDLNLGAKAAFLVDTHAHSFGIAEKAVIEVLRREKPDIILLGGDIIDEFTGSLAPVEEYLSLMEANEKYAVLGNHDHWCGRVGELSKVLERTGFKLISNEIYESSIGKILGLDWRDDRSYYSSCEADVVLVHDPNAALSIRGAHVILAGHTHGGVVLGGITIFSNSAFVRGLYELENGSILYVSRGLGQMIPLRPTSPLELVIIE